MIIEIENKPVLNPNSKWDDIPEFYKQLYMTFKSKEGFEFFKKFAGFVLTEKDSSNSENKYAFLDGRKSIVRELISYIKVMDGINR